MDVAGVVETSAPSIVSVASVAVIAASAPSVVIGFADVSTVTVEVDVTSTVSVVTGGRSRLEVVAIVVVVDNGVTAASFVEFEGGRKDSASVVVPISLAAGVEVDGARVVLDRVGAEVVVGCILTVGTVVIITEAWDGDVGGARGSIGAVCESTKNINIFDNLYFLFSLLKL